jgi:hypothetical protein
VVHKRLQYAALELVYRWFWASTLHGVSPLSSHVMLTSLMSSRTILFYLSKWTSFPTASDNRFYWRPLLWERTISTLHWNLKVLFSLGHSINLLEQEDHGMKSHTSNTVRNHLITLAEMDLSSKRETAWKTRKTFLFSMVSRFHSYVFDIESLCIIFLCPLFLKISGRDFF